MATLKSTYSGSGYAPGYPGIAAEMFFDVDKVNGGVYVADPNGGEVPGRPGSWTMYPNLSNGQLAAVVRAWQRAAARSKSPSWPIAYELTIGALGWDKPGDRFIMTKEHAAKPAPPELVELTWQSVDELAKSLALMEAKLAPIPVDWTYPGYEAAARDAWTQMQREAGKTPAPPAPAAPKSSGAGLGILLILLAFAAGSTHKGR